jgi:glycosyltransferase involved in cell wall biosynthesis
MVESMGLAGDVTFTGYVPDEELPALYAAADALLMPSLYEGFGFPLLEAMACGTPVVCSRASSLPELAGDAALLVDPDDSEAFAAAITRLIQEPQLASTLRQRGLLHARQFTWEAAARQTSQLYHHVVLGSRSG